MLASMIGLKSSSPDILRLADAAVKVGIPEV
jgi:hypothetical protein